ncbi:hypothetical protein N2152v2_007873 [Parachlorella kessleri]
MHQAPDEADVPSFTASSRSVKRRRAAAVAAPAPQLAPLPAGLAGSSRVLRCTGAAELTAAADLAALAASGGAGGGGAAGRGTTTSNVGSSLLVDRTDSSDPPQRLSRLSNGTAAQQQYHRSDAPPPSGRRRRSSLRASWQQRQQQPVSLVGPHHAHHDPQQQQQQQQLSEVIDLSRDSSSELRESEPASHGSMEPPAAKRPCRGLALRAGAPPALPPEALWVEDRESPPFRSDDEDGHYQFEVGENFSRRFKIMRKFGEGTFGRVVECWDRIRRDYVAVKIIRNIQKYRDAAMVELEVLKTLEAADPSQAQGHCVRLLEWFDYRGHVCMVFERLGLSLYDFLRRNSYRPFPLEVARSFTRQLLESVAFMHSLGLVHTDLKPENILLRSQDVVKAHNLPGSKLCKRLPATNEVVVIDFGSATWEDEYHSAVVCTRHYRAPEVILGSGWSYPADLWSVGCILVELLTGEALFQTHENLEHLAMMECVLGAIPPHLAAAADENAAAYFRNNRLDWPGGAESRKSVKAVAKLRRLRDYLRQQGDSGSLQAHMDSLVDLLQRLLGYDPATRMTAEEALQHPFFEGEQVYRHVSQVPLPLHH